MASEDAGIPKQGPAANSGGGARISVMPEQFLALTRARELPMQAPTIAQPAVTASVPPRPPSAAGVRTAQVAASVQSGLRSVASLATRHRMATIWVAIAVVILIGGGITALLVLRSLPTPAPASTVPSQVPPPVPAPTPAPAPPPEPTPAPSLPTPVSLPSAPEPPAAQPVPHADTDGDGLTDAEEALLGTNSDAVDTDGDGFADAVELRNRYHPASATPQRLLDAGIVYEYAHPRDGWSVEIPRPWTIAVADTSARELVITTGVADETMTITTEDLPRGVALEERLNQRPDGRTLPPLEKFTTARGTTGYRRAGEPVAWFALSGSRALAIAHLVPPSARFPNLFELIVQSVAVGR